ncbi:MAG: ABC-F family ATP-binding cassette domain-containing protein [Anaerolineales bacterium]|nr:ABC-F family ATP-binding cassette domain-containing protein [Anaerolineales bacterium]
MAEILINLADIEVNLGGRILFDGLNWEIQDGQRVGLVGPNGAGKSTLMKLMAAELEPESGAVFRRSKLTWGRLEQEPLIDSERTVLQEALCAVPELTAVNEQLATAEAQMGDPAIYTDADALERVMTIHGRLLHTFEQLDGPRFESKVKDILTRLGFPQARWGQQVQKLSGGEKKLILLAQLLVRQPDILFLDEPDNHLDVPAKRRLEKVINSYKGCIIIISHDRYLLDEVATHIAELENGKLTLYHGNYSAYTTERELRRLRQQQL